MLTDIKSGLHEIATLLRRDSGLSAHLIAIANSAAYGGTGTIGSIEEALQRVGFGEVFRLVGVAANHAVGVPLRCYGLSAQRLLAHNLYSGLAAEAVARRAGLDERAAYTAGLLRRIGMVLLDRVGQRSLREPDWLPQAGAARLEQWEQSVFGVDHRQVTRMLFIEWKFPAQIVETAGGDGAAGPLCKALALADCIARAAGYGLPGREECAGITQEERLASGFESDDVEAIKEDVRVTFRNLSSLM